MSDKSLGTIDAGPITARNGGIGENMELEIEGYSIRRGVRDTDICRRVRIRLDYCQMAAISRMFIGKMKSDEQGLQSRHDYIRRSMKEE